jgi:ABC transport system ATP-binding/permease protein
MTSIDISNFPIRLEARNITQKNRLDDITFTIEPGQIIAIVGGSGAGKSTLLRTLLGLEKSTSGEVYINGCNFSLNYHLRAHIGYVPQDDIVHIELTVREALVSAAKLRLPMGSDIRGTVRRTIERVGLNDREHVKISNLSGGQRKRVSIAIELLANPKLILLDEPTSGLDPALDKQMMELLIQLSREGSAVVVVTHATANISSCDRVLFLGRGGKLCYFGSPTKCLQFFGCSDFTSIYSKLTSQENINLYSGIFRGSGYYQDWIDSYLRPTQNIRYLQVKIQDCWRQWRILARREIILLGRDRLNLILSLITAPLGIGLLKIGLGKIQPFTDPRYAGVAVQSILIFASACLWVGLFASLPQIVKEINIYHRERLIGIRVFPYLCAKLFTLSLLGIFQAGLVAWTIGRCFATPISPLISWEFGIGITCGITLLASLSLGLLISALARTPSQANSTLPVILIPQIIFSGTLFKLIGVGKLLSYFTISRWAIGALGSISNINSLAIANNGTYLFPFGTAYESSWSNLLLNISILVLHAIIYMSIAAWWMNRKV